jgi:hypothetical protein
MEDNIFAPVTPPKLAESEQLIQIGQIAKTLSIPHRRKLREMLEAENYDAACDSDSSDSTIPPKEEEKDPSKSIYTEEEKKQALSYAAEYKNYSLASRKMRESSSKKFNERSIREWAASDDLGKFYDSKKQEHRHKERLIVRVSPYAQVEEEVFSWFTDQRKAHLPIKGLDIKEKAKELSGDKNFKASAGWFSNFCKRWKIGKRLPTHQVSKLKGDTFKEIVTYLKEIRKRRYEIEILEQLPRFTQTVFINMDEVPLEFSSTGHTYDFKGGFEVSVLTSGSSKRRFTLVLAIASNGRILPPMIIFKGRTPLSTKMKESFDKRALLSVNPSGWMNNDKMKIWINLILDNFEREPHTRYILIMDQFSAHISFDTKEELTKKNIDLFVIPGGCTGLMQPLDTHINAPLKKYIGTKYRSWLKEKSKEKNVEKIPAVPYNDMISWTLEGLIHIPEALIIKSFTFGGNFY